MDVRAVIRELSLEREIRKSAGVVRNSFKTVAKEFRLDRGHCPSHPSFMRFRALAELKERGAGCSASS
jgi:hypothetical protein